MLVAEGRAMRHYVAGVAGACAEGECSIWALEVEGFEGRTKALTIEVRTAARLIRQVRGRYNAPPSEKQRAIVRRWAERAGLQVAPHAEG